MKFIYQQLDWKEIERRVREEQCRTGKRVTEVVLTQPEWHEFVSTLGYHSNRYSPPYHRFTLRQPMPRTSCFTSCFPDHAVAADVITVRSE